ncbi:alkaline phosphatase family protein [Rhizobium ruizarguesonis]|uniref:alkaline phosphatase family protein n=1 Tax=Rhizobium ruizarguesonis TaxID=2081791 RepID=UPI001032785A|nr:alkaline phosphatase family protein [Rhizobium ruizarguesonis]TBC68291.1 acid phosphatase [Rhizobium ruizarguesonis]TBD93672.1 acid phosphatase [Rhizobium ruizarguesonis]TBF03671.1 acid phosphatase [Rhizobium ruizarguesonis]
MNDAHKIFGTTRSAGSAYNPFLIRESFPTSIRSHPPKARLVIWLLYAVAAVVTALATNVQASDRAPRYDHIVVVVMENHSFDKIFSADKASYLRSLGKNGAVFTRSYGVAHPSQPNYFALFSGSTHGVKDDKSHNISKPNLASVMAGAGKRFVGYVEKGSPRKHNPWESFANAKGVEQPLNAFPSNFGSLPAVSFVIPNLLNDMHDGTIAQADIWLRKHLGAYASWAIQNNSLLIVTFDEDDYHAGNRIFTLLYGARIKPGQYATEVNHYSVLRTIEDIEGIDPIGASARVNSIAGIWHGP